VDATQRSKTCFFGTEPLQDSYFVVEDMGVTFGVRLGGVDRVALYGHMLRSRNCSYIFPFLWQPKIWHVLKLYGKGVADGHGECGELCAAFIRLVQSWLGCRETRGYKEKIKKSAIKQQTNSDPSLPLCSGRYLPTQLAQSRHFAEGIELQRQVRILGHQQSICDMKND